ncbi:MAG: RND family transporter [Ekhidna sp.]
MSTKGKVMLVLFLVITTSFLGWNLQYLAFDFELEKFFPRDDPDSQAYEIHKAQFGYDNNFLQIILERENGLFEEEFLVNATAFESSLNHIVDVESVFSPLSMNHVVRSPTGVVVFPLIHPEKPVKYISDSTRIFENEFYRASFGNGVNALCIVLEHAQFDDQNRSKNLLDAVQKRADKYGIDNIRMVGKLTATNVFIEFIQTDFNKFLIASIILSLILLLIIFRNFKVALLPFCISLLSIIWLFGLMGFLGFKINLLSSLLPPIILFVSMSDAVHLMNAMQKTKGQTKLKRMQYSVGIVWTPTLLTSVTTAIGFLSLLFINTEPVQFLGLFAGLGVLIAFIITFTFGLLISIFTSFEESKRVVEVPISFLHFLLRNKKTVMTVITIIILALIPGISNLRVNSFLLDDLPEESEVRQNFEFSDKHFGGSKPYEVRVEVSDTSLSIWDKKVMDQLLIIENYLADSFPLTNTRSPSTLLKYMNQAGNGGLNQFYGYPEDQQSYDAARKLINRIDPKRLTKLITKDKKAARVIGFFPEIGSFQTDQRNEKLLSYLGQNIDHDIISYRITGTTFLIDKSHGLLSRNLIKGLLFAIGIIGLILGIYFKSFKLMIISLIPNLIPLLMVAGVLGWLGISLKMTTSIIFTIAFGIAVDDTIHMMSYYLKNPNEDSYYRMKETFKHAGSAMLITSIIMIAGFGLFLFSEFGATFYLGLFVSLSLVIALVIDLTLLPLLLITFTKKNAKKRRSIT